MTRPAHGESAVQVYTKCYVENFTECVLILRRPGHGKSAPELSTGNVAKKNNMARKKKSAENNGRETNERVTEEMVIPYVDWIFGDKD